MRFLRSTYRCILTILIVAQAGSLAAPAQGDKEVRLLEPGKPIEREMSAGQLHPYTLTLKTGQYLQHFVEQRGINVALTLLAPDGAKLKEVNGQRFRQGIERLYWVSDSAGIYRLEVRAIEKDAPAGRYHVRVEEIRDATEKDRLQVAAVKADSEASQLEGQTEADSKTKAIAKYEEAMKLYREAGDRRGEGAALHRIGRVYWNQNQMQKALDYFNQAVPLYRETDDRQSGGGLLSDTGAIYGDINWDGFDFNKALASYDKALVMAQAIGDK